MPEKRRLREASASMLREAGKNRKNGGIRLKSAVAAVMVLSVLLIRWRPAGADTFFPQLYQHTIIEEIVASEAATTPSNVFFIDFTKYAVKPLVRNMTVELSEPVAYFSCALDAVSEKPVYADIPNGENVSRYYTIRFLSETTSKIANVTMIFALEKSEVNDKEDGALMLYRYDRRRIYECPLERIAEDDDFLYFKTTTEGYSFIAFIQATGTVEPWWPTSVAVIAIVTLMTFTAVIVYKRLKTGRHGER